jgi:hypothetical protein
LLRDDNQKLNEAWVGCVGDFFRVLLLRGDWRVLAMTAKIGNWMRSLTAIRMGVALAVWLVVALMAAMTVSAGAQMDTRYKWHDMDRPQPKVVDPGMPGHGETTGKAPADALVLFDGKDLSQWTDAKGGAPMWKVENGYFEVVAHTGDLVTKKSFGDMQLHLEFREPVPATGHSQERGNSGVIIMNMFEIQVLDSYKDNTYPDGQAGAVYGEYPPQVNASRPPGEWQTYDIIFHAPKFTDGKVTKKARVTVLHNGELVQDNVEIEGLTRNTPAVYSVVAETAPLHLQDHGHPVRYRNVWVRELGAGQ